MNKLRFLLGTCVLTLCLANVAAAGEILTPGISPPPLAAESSVTESATATESTGGSAVDVVLSGAIAVLQSLGFLAI